MTCPDRDRSLTGIALKGVVSRSNPIGMSVISPFHSTDAIEAVRSKPFCDLDTTRQVAGSNILQLQQPSVKSASPTGISQKAETAVGRVSHIQDSQGQILALPFRSKC